MQVRRKGYQLTARTRDRQGHYQARPTRLARGVQEVLNRRKAKPGDLPPGAALASDVYRVLLSLAVHGSSDELAGGRFRWMWLERSPCPCCGSATGPLRLREKYRDRARRKIARLKENQRQRQERNQCQ